MTKQWPSDAVINAWSEDCPEGVAIGKQLHANGELGRLAKQCAEISEVYDLILKMKEG